MLPSCLIARNLLPGLKTCEEVSTYMHSDGAATPVKPVMMSSCGEDSGADPDYMVCLATLTSDVSNTFEELTKLVSFVLLARIFSYTFIALDRK